MFAIPCMVALLAIFSNVSANENPDGGSQPVAVGTDGGDGGGDSSGGPKVECSSAKQVCYEVFLKGIKIKSENGKAQIRF